MPSSKEHALGAGLSLIEVMMALVVLGIVTMIFFQTSKYSGSNQTKTRSWTAEAAAIEKTMESLRSDYSMTQLQALSLTRIDSSQGSAKITVTARGSVPSTAYVGTDFPADMLAQVVVSASKVGEKDTLTISALLWVN
jgi:prepilin-type N-terminal cleavage/methylation domain-containing protein